MNCEKDHQTWICIRCLEKVKPILPNGGLMAISLGKI